MEGRKRLEGKSAVVTGAASGNGLAIASRFLDEGASVVFADINAAALERVVPGNARATACVADVTTPDDARAAVQTAVDTYGAIDILVNNAGIVRFSNFAELPLQEWDQVLRTNATGAFLFAQAAAAAMTNVSPGSSATRSIINVTSIEAHAVISSRGHPQVHYNASKGALHMLTVALAIELAPQGIRVNAIAPGIIDTPLTAQGLSQEVSRKWLLDRIPLGRVGQPKDVAGAAAFLASEDASYVTGATLVVDGGWTAGWFSR